MPALEEAIFARLNASTGVTSIVGSRIHPARLPQNPTYPAITYRRISGRSDMHQSGLSGMGEGRIQISCWTEIAEQGGGDYPQAKDLREEVRLALAGFRGTTAGVEIQSSDLTADLDLFEEELGVHQAAMDFFVRHAEATT